MICENCKKEEATIHQCTECAKTTVFNAIRAESQKLELLKKHIEERNKKDKQFASDVEGEIETINNLIKRLKK